MRQALDPVTERQVRDSAERLVAEFAGVFSEETVVRCVEESVELLGDVRVHTYVPVLAHRFAGERLRAAGQVEGVLVKQQPEVLFVCVRNAGTAPDEDIDPAVVEAMREIGVDLSEAFPKPLTDEVVRAADVVITMGCGDACPVYPGKRYEDWQLDDPAGRDLDTVRRIRDEIDRRVQALVASVQGERRTGPPSP